ncbi:MAG: histidinol dehydrogenase, partial [Treponemataceae bacterium]|nr:histidinol dehydrogenase [Treponemataceae bacterium]
MIKIVETKNIEQKFFEGRDFADSLEIVKTILADVKNSGDEALREYGAKFDVCSPQKFEIEYSRFERAAKKMQEENPALYDSLVYSQDLA